MKNSSMIARRSRPLICSAQPLTLEPGGQGKTTNHPAPNTPSLGRGRVKRPCTSSVAGIAGGDIEISSNESESVASDSTEEYKLSSSQIEEDNDADLDRARCETVTQAMLPSFLQAVCGARRASTTAQSPQGHLAGAKQPLIRYFPLSRFPFCVSSTVCLPLIGRITGGSRCRKSTGQGALAPLRPSMTAPWLLRSELAPTRTMEKRLRPTIVTQTPYFVSLRSVPYMRPPMGTYANCGTSDSARDSRG